MQLTYPGVYIEEVSSGVHTITGVATSIAAFVGYTARGPDHTPTELFSFADFERTFGGLAADSELSYAVQQFFANGGTDCFVVRVPKGGITTGVLALGNSASAVTLLLTARSSGAWSQDILASVDYNGLPSSDATAFNLTITDQDSGRTETFANVSMTSTNANYVQAVVNDPDNGSQLVVATAKGTTAPQISGIVVTPAPPGGGATGLAALDSWLHTLPGAFSGAAGFTVNVTPVGGTLTTVPVTLWAATNTQPPTSAAQLLQLLNIKISRALQASFPGAQVTTQAVAATPGTTPPDLLQITISLPGNQDATITFSQESPAPASGAYDLFTALGLGAPTVANVAAYSFLRAGATAAGTLFQLGTTAGGVTPSDKNGTLPVATDLIGDEAVPGPGGTFYQTGIYALDKVDLFNILSIPDATRPKAGTPNTPDLDDASINSIYAAAMDYCKKRRAFLLVDSPPDAVDLASALNWRNKRLTVNDLNGAVYFPRVRLADPLNQSQLRSFAPSGVVAGLYATEDGNRGVWKAPAGIETNMSGVQKLTYDLTDSEQGVLNPLALNCFRNFPIYGPVIWGARTLVGSDAQASEWKYVPVRRFALFLEESLYRGLQWAVFEPNAEPLWAQIRMNVTSFMQTLFRQNAFQGQTPAQAYFVNCDSTTTTQNDIDSGVVNIQVGFAPLKPAEFVVVQLQQMAGQLVV